MTAFCGFPERTVGFLAELARNNNRAWFEAHQRDYEAAILAPAKALVTALGPRLRQLDPKVQALPRVLGSIKSLERRVRLRRGEQPPYKEYLDLWFWSGRRRAWDNSGFFLRLAPASLTLAAGMIEFQRETLARYREQVLEEQRGSALARIVGELRAGGYCVGGESYKRTPRGVPADHARAALSRHGGLFATWRAEHPRELGTAELVDFAFDHFARLAPLHAWLAGLGK